MQSTVEITMYPIRDDYLPPIKGVIERLNGYADIEVRTFATATVLLGDYDVLMHALGDCIRWSHEQFGAVVFVAKIIPGYVPDE